MSKKRIYISGPISGTDDWLERFARAEADIEKMHAAIGEEVEVINPARIDMPKGTTWQQYIDISLQMLRGCDGIYMLANWRFSKGAKLERLYADGSGMVIFYE